MYWGFKTDINNRTFIYLYSTLQFRNWKTSATFGQYKIDYLIIKTF